MFIVQCSLYHHRQADGKLGAFAQFTLGLDFALMQIDHLLDVGQSETKAFHVVLVAGMYAVELVEYLLQVLLLDAQAVVLNGEVQVLLVVPRLDHQFQRLIWVTVFHRIVQQVVNHVREVHLVNKDSRVNGSDVHQDFSARVLHSERKRVGNVLQQFVQVHVLLLEHGILLVEHRHLEHLLHQEPQSF